MSGANSTADYNLLASLNLISALAEAGVRDFVISSGSRCAPLVLAASRCNEIRILTHFDERSAGFLALGNAKASRRPAALICTSGTAAANYFPAVVESRLSHTPLVILTADRPPELRGTGASQTIDQLELYGSYPLHFADLPVPIDGRTATVWAVRGAEAARVAAGFPSGPVHLNLPFREPLIPDPSGLERIVADFGRQTQPKSDRRPVVQDRGEQPWDEIAARLAGCPRGLIVCGPQNTHDDLGVAVSALATRLGIPILADVASQVRFGPHCNQGIISHFDLCLRERGFGDSVRPDLVLRLGGLPTSKVLNEWLASLPPHEHILIDESSDIADPDKIGTARITADLVTACVEISRRLNGKAGSSHDYLHNWQQAERTAANVLEPAFAARETGFGGSVVRAVFQSAPDGTPIFLSNSLPIRWAEFYATGGGDTRRVFYNRGANGIDGIVSTAGGVAAALARPTVLIVGDVTMLHDLNGLAAVRQYDLPLKIVLLNNDGGGIFSYLPIAGHRDVNESLVAMPHGRDFRCAAALWEIPYQKLESVSAFISAFAAALAKPGPAILEFPSTRDGDVAASWEIERRVASAMTGAS